MKTLLIPFDNSYWVRPGLLLAGDYPGARPGYANRTEEQVDNRLQALAALDINAIVDLTYPGEGVDYWAPLQKAANQHNLKIEYLHCPVQNMDVPTIEEMQVILNQIDRRLFDNKAVYVHCMAGIGRTGTVIGCHLIRHGIPAESILSLLQELRKNISYSVYPSPENEMQKEFVLAWKKGL